MEKNGNLNRVTWTQLVAILAIAGSILGTLWMKLEKIDDAVGKIETNVALIRQQLDNKHVTSSGPNVLDKMYEKQ